MASKIVASALAGCGLLFLGGCSDKLLGLDGNTTYLDGVEKVCTNGRYLVTDLGTDGCGDDGSGLVQDTVTHLTWKRKQNYPLGGQTFAQAEKFCIGEGMRLPTREEALGIAGTKYDYCAFPCAWWTWTSTYAAKLPGNDHDLQDAYWLVHYQEGVKDRKGVSDYHYVLCVSFEGEAGSTSEAGSVDAAGDEP